MNAIEVICNETGDRAEATSPRSALVAARTLMREAAAALGAGARPTCAFYVAGEVVLGLASVGRQTVWFALYHENT